MIECAGCTCRRCDALEEQVKDIEARLSAMERVEVKAINHARLMAARDGAELIDTQEMMRRKGKSRGTVMSWQARPDFPHWVKDWSGRAPRLWSAVEFERWYAEYCQKNRFHGTRKK